MRDVIPTTDSVGTHQISLAGNQFTFFIGIILFCVKLDILPEEFRIRIITFQIFHVHPVSGFRTMPQIGFVHFIINRPQIVLIESGSTKCRYTTSQSAHIIIFLTILAVFASIVGQSLLSIRHFDSIIKEERIHNTHGQHRDE